MKESQSKRSLTGAVAIVMVSIVASRIIGFLREMLLPNMIGMNHQTDAYTNAFLFPDLMYNLLIGGAISAALIPVLSGYIEKEEEESGWRAISTFMNTVFLIMMGVCILGVLFAPQLVSVVAGAPGKEATRILTARLTRILFPSVAFLMLAGLVNGVLNANRRFTASSLGPIIYNVGSALSILIFSRWGITYVAAGVMISSLVYFLIQFLSAKDYFEHYRPIIDFSHPGSKRLFKLAIPSFLSSSIVQINIIISARFVNRFAVGAVTAFRAADRTWQLPYGIFAMGMGIAILPTLSAKMAVGEIEDYKLILSKALKNVLLPVIPCAVALVLLSDTLIRGIYQFTGRFTDSDVALTAGIIMFFSVALISQSVVAIVNRAFYAVNDTKTPLITGASSILINLVLSNLFYYCTSLGVKGMALSYSLSSMVNGCVLLWVLHRRVGGLHLRTFAAFAGKVGVAAVLMGLTLKGIDMFIPVMLLRGGMAGKTMQLLYLGTLISLGAVIFFAVCFVWKVEEVVEWKERIMKKIIKKAV